MREFPDPDLIFNAAGHSYHLISDSACHLESVTSFIHRHTPPFQAVEQATRVAKRQGRPVDAILAEWAHKGYQARSLGTAVHQYLESAILTLATAGELSAPPDSPYTGPAAMWLASHPELAYGPLLSEVRIADPDRRLAGSIDLFCHLDGIPTLVDFKTSATIEFIGYGLMLPPFDRMPNANGVHYAIQLSLYASILRRHYGIEIEQLVIVHLGKTTFTELVVGEIALARLHNVRFSIIQTAILN